jgi:hypothetical protein
MANEVGFRGNPFLRKAYTTYEYEDWQLDEIEKCQNDPIYFIETYAKIVSLDKGTVPFKLFPYQKEVIEMVHENRLSVAKMGRQLGKCVQSDTKYTIRNKQTGEIYSVTAKELHECIGNPKGKDIFP